jgi:hypothetical protein
MNKESLTFVDYHNQLVREILKMTIPQSKEQNKMLQSLSKMAHLFLIATQGENQYGK